MVNTRVITASATKGGVAFRSDIARQENIIGLVGHSMLDQGMSGAGATVAYALPRSASLHLRAYPPWIALLSQGRYVFPEDCKFAVSGQTSTQVLATQLAGFLACRAKVGLYHVGRNDFNAGATLASLIANATEFLTATAAAGKIILAMVEIPGGDATYPAWRLNATNMAVCHGYRSWLLTVAPKLWPGMVYGVDTWPDAVDYTSAVAGDVRLGETQDGVHPNARLSARLARRVISVLDGLGMPPRSVPVHMPGDIAVAANAATANLISRNPSLLSVAGGSVPAAAGGVTFAGAVPQYWGLSANSAAQAGSLTVTTSLVTTATGPWLQFDVVGNTAANAGPGLYLDYYTYGPEQAFMVAGDNLQAFGEYEIGAGGVGVCGVSQEIARVVGGVGDQVITHACGDDSGPIDTIIAGADLCSMWDGSWTISKVSKTESSLYLRYRIIMSPSKAVNFRVRMRNIALRKAGAS